MNQTSQAHLVLKNAIFELSNLDNNKFSHHLFCKSELWNEKKFDKELIKNNKLENILFADMENLSNDLEVESDISNLYKLNVSGKFKSPKTYFILEETLQKISLKVKNFIPEININQENLVNGKLIDINSEDFHEIECYLYLFFNYYCNKNKYQDQKAQYDERDEKDIILKLVGGIKDNFSNCYCLKVKSIR